MKTTLELDITPKQERLLKEMLLAMGIQFSSKKNKREDTAKTGLSRMRGIFATLPEQKKEDLQQQLDNLRNEWERPIY
jgi:hypothetical protein